MAKPSAIFVEVHGLLLETFGKVKKISNKDHAMDVVRNNMSAIRSKIASEGDISSIVAFERYCFFYQKKFSNDNIYYNYTLINSILIKKEIEKDPSRYDLLLQLAIHYYITGQYINARSLLKKIARSEFPESEIAKKILVYMLNGVVK